LAGDAKEEVDHEGVISRYYKNILRRGYENFEKIDADANCSDLVKGCVRAVHRCVGQWCQ
jgi:hypothetical protein